jgi:hypothetical protein
MVQDVISLLIIASSAFYALYSLYRVVFPLKKKSLHHCAGCSGCPINLLPKDSNPFA